MKVVHLVPAMEQGGVETVVCDLNRVLVKVGWESMVISKGGRLERSIERDGGRHIRLDLKTKNPLTYFSRAHKLRAILHVEKPDLVCVHSRVPAWLFVWANRTLGLKWITYAHGANSVSKYSEVMTRGNLIITPSNFLADYLKTNYGTSDAKIRVVPNAIDAERFNPANLDQEFIAAKRLEWGIDASDHVTMAIGRITPVKGLDSLIREFATEFAKSPDRKLVIVGGADKHHHQYLEALKTLAASLIPHHTFLCNKSPIIFAGQQSKIPECISIADVVVSANTTKPESFGLSIIEAYAMNKPVKAKRFGGAAEIMAAVEALGSVSLREAAVSLYGIDKFSVNTLSVYRELVNMV